MNVMIGNQAGNNSVLRDYRKGNWTLQETMVLIEAKRMDDERRMKRLGDVTERGKPAELRWKWVEDYCWKNGCLRSQNQCNDKWDNLMRDFKKVREYEQKIRVTFGGREDNNNNNKSYWRIERNERKENHLPSNMLPQIYEALMGVVERRGLVTTVRGGSRELEGMVGSDVVVSGAGAAGEGSGSGSGSRRFLLGHDLSIAASQVQVEAVQQQQGTIVQPQPQPLSSLPVETTPTPTEAPPNLPFSHHLPTVDSDTSEYSDSPAKRRKKRGDEGTTSGSGANNSLQEVGTAITKSAALIAEALKSSEEREERRHREILSLHERRLQIEESKAEINRQGISGLVDAVNKLANSILALAGNNNRNQTG